jgi:hypothetical protein
MRKWGKRKKMEWSVDDARVDAFTRLKRASNMSCPNAQHNLSTTCTTPHTHTSPHTHTPSHM